VRPRPIERIHFALSPWIIVAGLDA
jgi:hypothetical protein